MVRTVPRKVYTFDEVCDLDLDDTPYLGVRIKGVKAAIQTSHINDVGLRKNCPEFGQSKWLYLYTTDEWIPIFEFAGTEEELLKIVDYEDYIDPYDPSPGLWVTPKGSPREQYYKKED